MGEKGSLKNRIKDFFKIRKKRMKKKQKEELILKKKIEQERIKNKRRYSRTKIIFTIIGGYFLTSIGYLITKKKTSTENTYIKLNKLENQIETVDNHIELEHIKEETYVVQDEIIKNKTINFKLDKKINKIVEKVEKKQEAIKINKHDDNLKEIKTEMVKEQEHEKNSVVVKENIIKFDSNIDELIKIEKSVDKVTNATEIEKLKEKISIYENRNLTDDEKEIIKRIKAKIEEKNKKINNVEKEILKISKEKEEIKQTTNNNYLENKKVLPALLIVGGMSAHIVGKVSKEIINSIKFEEDNLDENKEIDSKIENQDEMKENDDVIINDFSSENEVDNNKKKEENKIINEPPVVNKEKEDSEKIDKPKIEEKTNISLDKFYISVEEIRKADEIIKKQILIEKKEIEEIQIKLLKIEPKVRKKSFLNIIGKRIADFSLAFTPFAIFKNKLIGGLVGAVILNHRIKNTRKINQKVEINYYYNVKYILKSIIDKKDILEKTININFNSISEIGKLRDDILKEIDYDFDKYPEVFNIINKLNLEEEKLRKKNEELEKQLEKIKKLEEKGKVKIKKIENS